MTTLNTYMQGQKAFLGGDFESSITDFTSALQQGIHPFHSHLSRGIAYFNIGQFKHAINDFDAIIDKDNSYERAYFYRGLAKLNMEEHEEAIRDFNKSLTISPDRGNTYLARGLAYLSLGNIREAEKNIYDTHVLSNVELGEFMEEYILSELLFNRIVKFFETDKAKWRLLMTATEVLRMDTVH